MNRAMWTRCSRAAALAFAAIALAAGVASAATFNLRADLGTLTLPDPDGAGPLPAPVVNIWGFACDSAVAPAVCPNPGVVTVPGPALVVPPGDTALTINLTNNLPDPVSLIIPGQPATLTPRMVTDTAGRSRVASFTSEAAGLGGTASYTWSSLKPGTYLYQSGSNPGKQVPLGLYGALTADAAAGQAYTGVAYDAEVVLIFSEVDTTINAAPAPAKPLSYKPQYFLVNGQPWFAGRTPLAAGNAGQRVLVRMLNAGLKTHIPALEGGDYLSLVAEDGNPYSYLREQYSAHLPAGKTLDAVWVPQVAGTYSLYDRSFHLTSAGVLDGGMRVALAVGGTVAPPVATADAYLVVTNTPLAVAAPGVLANDAGVGPTALADTVPVNGILALNADGSFTYTPNAGFVGVDSFTYHAVNAGGASAPVAVTLTVNDPPVATPEAYVVAEDGTLNVPAPGVLLNDTDANADPLSAVLVAGTTQGALTFLTNGSFIYAPAANFNGTDSFTYKVNDGKADSATVAATITVSPVNDAPVAVDDSANTKQNVAVFINMIRNDYDPDDPAGVFGSMPGSTVDRNSIVIVTQPRRAGSLVVLTDGVTYTPRANFKGTDEFSYRMRDLSGTLSNIATVRVNVVK